MNVFPLAPMSRWLFADDVDVEAVIEQLRGQFPHASLTGLKHIICFHKSAHNVYDTAVCAKINALGGTKLSF